MNAPMAAPVDARPPKLQTIADIDHLLAQLAAFLTRTPPGDASRVSALSAIDRLLDQRLEIRGR